MLKKLECKIEKILARSKVQLSDRDYGLLLDRGFMTNLGPFAGLPRIGDVFALTECTTAEGKSEIHIHYLLGRYPSRGWTLGLSQLYGKRFVLREKESLGPEWAIITIPERKPLIRDHQRFLQGEARKIARSITKAYLD
ncbi:MAG TPA: hypothetical protein VJH67_00120 [Candidatus Paceibacterota bacterium]